MMVKSAVLWFLVILGHFSVHSLDATIKQRVVVGKKKFQCTFVLKYTDLEVDIRESRLTCSPKKPKIKSAQVDLISDEYTFTGTIKINPTKIISMDVHPPPTTRSTPSAIETTTGIEGTTNQPNQTSGVEEIEFKELYNNVSFELRQEHSHFCGIEPVEENMKRMTKSYTSTAPDKFWKNGVVPWSFVSAGDEMAKYAVHTDANVGLTKADVDTVMAAMKQIEAKTCIKFNLVKPVKGQPWLFVSRESRASDLVCQLDYAKSNLVGKDVEGLGDIYRRLGYNDGCFPGAYAFYGSSSPQNFVISKTTLSSAYQSDIGLVVHEVLHNLGLGHTQKRQDAAEHIDIKWENIDDGSKRQYEACIAANDIGCSRYNDYGTPYDCMSIMHYRDTYFITDAARRSGGKTMVAKKEGCDLSSSASSLSNADVEILKKMYCANSPQEKVIMSLNHPANYPDNQDKEYPISVDDGFVIGLWFTEFKIEEHSSCGYDWVQVVDGDGTVLLDKSCGETKPARITSRTKSLTVKFHSDSSENFAGFRAEYEPVGSAPTPVAGGWSDWSGFSSCTNGKDGKSVCKKKKVRYCNNPAAANGGKPCEGDAEMFEDCVPAWTVPAKNLDCVLTGGWSAWSEPSTCSSLCSSTKTRTCTNPIPLNSKECEGKSSESSTCTGGDCPSSTTGTIKSTNYPANYPDNADLTFPLVVEDGSQIELTFTAFDLEANSNCAYDYVKVLDTDGTTQLAKLCGDSIPSKIKSSGNKLTVVFHSDGDINKKGFQATWNIASGATFGEVTSPGYPSSYPNSQNQVKTISVISGSKIELTFSALNIEAGANCPYDKLTIYDSASQSGDKLAELCGSTLPTSPILSTGNAMTLVFTSDGSIVSTGFKATWKVKL